MTIKRCAVGFLGSRVMLRFPSGAKGMTSPTNAKSNPAATRQAFSAATRPPFSAATRRQDVAMGVSPWPSDSIKRSPDGTTGSVASGPSGLHACVHGNHGLKPVATTYRPFGTSIRRPLGTNVLGFPLPSRGNR